ncbi:hypothetical protein FHS74_000846 [Nitrospirillum iridis]|uniref:Uncharacterized protein n=1 Tax=Nitrospirillum iridis TaxID=765888 RepID=A0A7X0EBP2_9PROT|nr:hypothetical protein [Nitrospirillum iridis]
MVASLSKTLALGAAPTKKPDDDTIVIVRLLQSFSGTDGSEPCRSAKRIGLAVPRIGPYRDQPLWLARDFANAMMLSRTELSVMRE